MVDRDFAFVLEDSDVIYEEDILRNPHSVQGWLRYLNHRKQRPGRNMIYERAVKALPGSYKLWYMYLTERRRQVKGRCVTDPSIEALNNTYERCLVFLHKMPRIWIEYCQFMVEQRRITRTRHVFDRALRALPLTQHDRIWPMYLKFVRSHPIPDTAVKVYRRYLQINPQDAEEYINYLVQADRLDEACQRLAYDCVNKEDFVSQHGKSQHQLWVELCELMSQNPDKVVSLKVDAIIRGGLSRFTDMTGKLWTCLAEYYIGLGLLEKARDIYEEAMLVVSTVRDFSQVFDAYAQFEEQLLNAKIKAATDAEDDAPDEALDQDIDLRMARFEFLMDRRPLLLNSVLLRQNPHNVNEWLKRAELYKGQDDKIVESFTQAISTVDATKAVGRLADVWVEFAKYYESKSRLKDARATFEKGSRAPFKTVDELSHLWCQYAEMELRQKAPQRALSLMQQATSAPARAGKSVDFFDPAESVQRRLHKSVKLWTFYVDLEESIGTFQSTKAVYERILELRIATPQIIINYGLFLEENKFYEDAFRVYEKGVGLFKWPVVFDIWNTYLTKFVRRYGGNKLERARDLFEQCLEGCPAKYAKTLYLLYAKLEEDHGLARHAMAVYDRATQNVELKERYEMFSIYIKRASEIFGVTHTRPIFDKAIEVLNDRECKQMCVNYAEMERKLGEIDRARAIYQHASQLADPRVDPQYWSTWQEFEVRHGNEDTFREMLRVKRSVQAHFNSQVSYISAHMVAAKQAPPPTLASTIPTDKMAALEAQVTADAAAAGAAGGKSLQFVRAAPAAFDKMGDSVPFNPAEINLDVDDDEDEDDEDDGSDQTSDARPSGVKITEKSIPAAVFGGIAKQASSAMNDSS
ncbi:XPA binding protein [Capsaspora owczarzaki ATCC 30864]|uniref:XPA binding protein n=1 Tax=Capsaspora owczarzaki (strain ATCC 30864) TaxID=595528 RepID=UPI000352064F|nr:XPA binding protein [Capsaspora owczarzaki ATCC 30864]|eukprot:XP_004348871.2 XPA binding protein [Capsaspora owczarzaki ATCC 30864]